MVGYLLILLYTVLNLGESIAVRTYARRHGNGGLLMSAVTALFASLFFLLTDKGGFYAPTEMILLAILNAFLFAAGFYFTFLSFQYGPFGLTRLISGFSLLFTIGYGILFLKETATTLTYIGIAMIIAAMTLVNYQKNDDQKRVSLKWFFSVTISLFANGFIGILTRMQQIRFDNACSNEFQFISIGGSFVLLTLITLFRERDKFFHVLKTGSLYGLCTGILNGAKNFTTLFIYLLLPLSVVSPLQMGLSLLSAFAMAFCFYKEKYSKQQLLGVLIGTVAMILLTL